MPFPKVFGNSSASSTLTSMNRPLRVEFMLTSPETPAAASCSMRALLNSSVCRYVYGTSMRRRKSEPPAIAASWFASTFEQSITATTTPPLKSPQAPPKLGSAMISSQLLSSPSPVSRSPVSTSMMSSIARFGSPVGGMDVGAVDSHTTTEVPLPPHAVGTSRRSTTTADSEVRLTSTVSSHPPLRAYRDRPYLCLLYTSDAADDLTRVDLG